MRRIVGQNDPCIWNAVERAIWASRNCTSTVKHFFTRLENVRSPITHLHVWRVIQHPHKETAKWLSTASLLPAQQAKLDPT